MSKLRKLNGYRHSGIVTPLEFIPRRDKRVVYYSFSDGGCVETPDGLMRLVCVKNNVSLVDPSIEIASLLGSIRTVSGVFNPELWFWNDAFWLKACRTNESEYYHEKKYLFYQIEVPDEICEHIFQTVSATP